MHYQLLYSVENSSQRGGVVKKSGFAAMFSFGVIAVPAAAQAQDQLALAQGSPSQTIIVTGVRDGYQADTTSTATRTPTELNDVPQSVSVITEAQIDDQAMRSIADVLRYVPGAVISQGRNAVEKAVLSAIQDDNNSLL